MIRNSANVTKNKKYFSLKLHKIAHRYFLDLFYKCKYVESVHVSLLPEDYKINSILQDTYGPR